MSEVLSSQCNWRAIKEKRIPTNKTCQEHPENPWWPSLSQFPPTEPFSITWHLFALTPWGDPAYHCPDTAGPLVGVDGALPHRQVPSSEHGQLHSVHCWAGPPQLPWGGVVFCSGFSLSYGHFDSSVLSPTEWITEGHALSSCRALQHDFFTWLLLLRASWRPMTKNQPILPANFWEAIRGSHAWWEAGGSILELRQAGQQKGCDPCIAAMMSVNSACPGLTVFLMLSLVSRIKTDLGSEKIFPFEM